jgi:hypothetical protein
MNLKRLLLTMAGAAILASIVASSAMGAVETRESRWYVNHAGLEGGHSANVKCSVGTHNESKLVLSGEIGEATKVPVKLTATGIECINNAGTGGNGTASIVQEGSPGSFSAHDEGRLRFTGVTVSEPPNCAVEGGTVTTNELVSELYMDSTLPAITFDKFEPKTGAAGNFATVKVINKEKGVNCSVAGNRIAKGVAWGEAENHTGVEAVNQPLTFSLPGEETAGGSGALVFAGNPAHLTGTVNNELAGASAGLEWGAEEN